MAEFQASTAAKVGQATESGLGSLPRDTTRADLRGMTPRVGSFADTLELTGVDVKKIDKLSEKINSILKSEDIGSFLKDDARREELTGILKDSLKELTKVAGAEVVDGQVGETIRSINKLIRISEGYPAIKAKGAAELEKINEKPATTAEEVLTKKSALLGVENLIDQSNLKIIGTFGAELGNLSDNLAVSLPYVNSKVVNAKGSLPVSSNLGSK